MNWHADESRVAVVLLSLSRIWHRVKSNPSYPSGDSVSMNEVDHVIVFKSFPQMTEACQLRCVACALETRALERGPPQIVAEVNKARRAAVPWRSCMVHVGPPKSPKEE